MSLENDDGTDPMRPTRGSMLNEKQVGLLVEKLRTLAENDLDAAIDAIEVLQASFRGDKKEPVQEIAKTVCEILEPERCGGIVWLTCHGCSKPLEEWEKFSRYCRSCAVFRGGESEATP